MKPRVALVLVTAAALLVALPLGVAAALTGGTKYAGKTNDGRAVALRLTSDAKHVKRFHIRYTVTCAEDPPGDMQRPATYTDILNAKVRSDDTFRATGTYVGSGDGSTNKFKLAGKLFRKKASGTFSLKATAADASLHCTTGKLTWKASKAG
jgi:hypothetical protein